MVSTLSYYFEYGTSASYGHDAPAPPTDNGTGLGHQTVPPVSVTGLVPGTTYHFRLVASNSTGVAYGLDETFTTYQAPTIEAFSTSDVTATSADPPRPDQPTGLPAATEAEYRLRIRNHHLLRQQRALSRQRSSGTTGQAGRSRNLGLQPGVRYHFRVIAHNRWGDVTSEDQSFEFFPPACPNSAVRQQTGSGYLPDCRAYELVSPANANGTLLFAGGPNTGRATAPSRFAFTGAFSSLPGSDVIGTAGDLYVATRTNTGWVSKYVGPPGDEAGCVGGPPNDPWSRHGTSPTKIQTHVLTDPSMSRFLDFFDGTPDQLHLEPERNRRRHQRSTSRPTLGHLWCADGASSAPFPLGSPRTSWPPSTAPILPGEGLIRTGGLQRRRRRLRRSQPPRLLLQPPQLHPGGSTAAPGAAYDYDLATGTVTLISALAGGGDIPQARLPDCSAIEVIAPLDRQSPSSASPPSPKTVAHPHVQRRRSSVCDVLQATAVRALHRQPDPPLHEHRRRPRPRRL